MVMGGLRGFCLRSSCICLCCCASTTRTTKSPAHSPLELSPIPIHQHPWPPKHPAANPLRISTLQRKHAHDVAQLEVDTSEGHDLQEHDHKERRGSGQRVEHGRDTKSNGDNQGNPGPGHDDVEEPGNRALGHTVEAGDHAEEKANWQKHGVDDEKDLGEDHDAGQEEDED